MWLEDICVPHWSLPELWKLGFGLHLSADSAAFWPHELMIAQKVHSTATCNYSLKSNTEIVLKIVSAACLRVELYTCTVSCSIYRSDDCTCIALHVGSFDLKIKSRMVCFCILLLRNSTHERWWGKKNSLSFPLI